MRTEEGSGEAVVGEILVDQHSVVPLHAAAEELDQVLVNHVGDCGQLRQESLNSLF